MRPVVSVCVVVCVSLVLLAGQSAAKRRGGGFSSRRGGGSTTSYKQRTPAPPSRPKTDTSSSSHFLSSERAGSSSTGTGTTYNRGNPFSGQPAKPPTAPQTNGPVGFEKFGGGTNQQGSQKIGFDKVNSEVQNKPAGSYNPSAPPYPGGSASHVPSAPQPPANGPPPGYYQGSYSGNSYSGANDHPPAYPGRPVNAPPTYTANNPQFGQSNAPQPGFGTNYPNQYNSYQGQGHSGQPNYANPSYGNTFGSYPQQNQFGNAGHGFPSYGGSSYPGNTGYNPGYTGGSFGGSSQYGNPYQGNAFGGSPFGGSYNGNPHYSPNNFGYSNNPGYFGSQGYSGYPGQYDNYQKKSRFGGLPIPIPIPIPIPLGGFGSGFGSGFGGFGGSSYNHRLLDTFIKSNGTVPAGNSSTSVFILNNSTVTPCTTDHFVYDLLKVSIVSCTAEFCTAVKVYTTTNVSNVVSVHSAAVTMCLEKNATESHYGENVTPTVSDIQRENLTVCRDVPNNVTVKAENSTAKSGEEVTTLPPTTVVTTVSDSSTSDASNTTDAITTVEATSTPFTTLNSTTLNSTRVCEIVECSWVEMCLPSVEIVDQCTSDDCPFRRTGYKPCVTVKMCRSPSNPLSTFASINTTISKIDEFNRQNSVFDAANLTLISYHRPVISFNCTKNSTAPGCVPPPPPPASPPPSGSPPQACLPTLGGASPVSDNSTLCSSNTTVTTDSVPVTTQPSSPPPA